MNTAMSDNDKSGSNSSSGQSPQEEEKKNRAMKGWMQNTPSPSDEALDRFVAQRQVYRQPSSDGANDSDVVNDIADNNDSIVIGGGGGDVEVADFDTLSMNDDINASSPFAIRRGRSLCFSNICMSVKETRTKQERVILDNVWGSVPAGQVTAIMGTSGSGKTSLLNVLSGRIADSPKIRVQADHVYLNEKAVDPTNRIVRQTIAFVAQDDSLQVTATPREAIYFSARLRRPRTCTAVELHALTERMLRELHLLDCADTLIGSALVKGVSGGERKRTSVGVELVTQPSLVFLDEPTSGLDSFNAMELILLLKRVAAAGAAALLTIHQPSSEIFSALDGLLLLEKHGRVLFGGMRSDVPEYFSQRGYACPSHYNPADWILHIAQTVPCETLLQQGFYPTDPSNNNKGGTSNSFSTGNGGQLASSSLSLSKKLHRQQRRSTHSLLQAAAEPKLGFLRQIGMLFKRELQNLRRNKKALTARSGMTLMVSTLGGIIFFQVGKTDFTQFINVQSTFGALLMALLANVFATALPSVVAIPEERPVFLREYSTNHYSVSAYFCSRLAMELLVTAGQVLVSSVLTFFLMGLSAPFGIFWSACYTLAMTSTALGVLIGCSVKDPGMAVEFMPLVFMPQILFAGFFVPPELIPVWLRWLSYIFPLVYAVKIAVVAQFNGGVCDGLEPNYCNVVMDNANANPDDTWWYWLILVCQFVFFRSVALIVLRCKATRYY